MARQGQETEIRKLFLSTFSLDVANSDIWWIPTNDVDLLVSAQPIRRDPKRPNTFTLTKTEHEHSPNQFWLFDCLQWLERFLEFAL